MEESNKGVSMSNVNSRLHRIIQDKHAPKLFLIIFNNNNNNNNNFNFKKWNPIHIYSIQWF
jgi:hypothetical protein